MGSPAPATTTPVNPNMKNLLIALALLGVAAAIPGLRHRRDSLPFQFQLPSNASLVLGGITTGFECGDLPYGYYADEANSCAIFHVCLPYIENDVYVTRHFSFMCDFPENSVACQDSSSFRRANEYFGREVNFN